MNPPASPRATTLPSGWSPTCGPCATARCGPGPTPRPPLPAPKPQGGRPRQPCRKRRPRRTPSAPPPQPPRRALPVPRPPAQRQATPRPRPARPAPPPRARPPRWKPSAPPFPAWSRVAAPRRARFWTSSPSRRASRLRWVPPSGTTCGFPWPTAGPAGGRLPSPRTIRPCPRARARLPRRSRVPRRFPGVSPRPAWRGMPQAPPGCSRVFAPASGLSPRPVTCCAGTGWCYLRARRPRPPPCIFSRSTG